MQDKKTKTVNRFIFAFSLFHENPISDVFHSFNEFVTKGFHICLFVTDENIQIDKFAMQLIPEK